MRANPDKTYGIQITERSKLYLKISLFTITFLNLSVFISGRWALLFLRLYFVSFFFGMMLLSWQSGSTERTSKSFLSAFSKKFSNFRSLRCVFAFKASIQKVLYDREIWVYSAINRQTISEIGKTKALNRWSTSPWLKPSSRKDLNTNRHLQYLP